jgi:hypothetical protein
MRTADEEEMRRLWIHEINLSENYLAHIKLMRYSYGTVSNAFLKSIFRSIEGILFLCRNERGCLTIRNVSIIFLPCLKVVWFLKIRHGINVMRQSSRRLVMSLGMEEITLIGRKSYRWYTTGNKAFRIGLKKWLASGLPMLYVCCISQPMLKSRRNWYRIR